MPVLTTDPPPTTAPPQQPTLRAAPSVTELAAGTAVAVRRRDALTEPVPIDTAATLRGIAISTVQAVFEALWQLAAPTAGVLVRAPNSAVAAAAGCSLSQANRAIPLLREFGLLARRGRMRGAWDTTIPALVAAAAADTDALDALLARPAAPEPTPRPAAIAAATLRTAAAAGTGRMPQQPPKGLACEQPEPCDLSSVTEAIAGAVGVQARNHSWQDDLRRALQLGWSPRQLVAELVRSLDSASDVAAVCRSRLQVVIGRVPQAHRHCCGTWAPPQPPPGTAERHTPPWLTHKPHNGTLEHTSQRESTPARTRNPRPQRETNRKDPLENHSPPQTPPTPGGAPRQADSTAAPPAPAVTELADQALTEARSILGVTLRTDVHQSWADTLAAQLGPHASTALDDRLDLVLGLVAGAANASAPAGVLRYRVFHPEMRAAQTARYRAAARQIAPAGLTEPAAAAAFTAHAHRQADQHSEPPDAQALTARQDAALAAADEQATRRSSRAAERAAAVSRSRAAAGAALAAAAAAVLGRPLSPAAARLAGTIADAPPAAVAVLMRRHSGDAALAQDLAAVCSAAGIAADLAAEPPVVLPRGPLRRRLEEHAAAAPPGPDGAQQLAAAISRGAPPPDHGRNPYGALRPADLDHALTELAQRSLAAETRRAWAQWIIAQRTAPAAIADPTT